MWPEATDLPLRRPGMPRWLLLLIGVIVAYFLICSIFIALDINHRARLPREILETFQREYPRINCSGSVDWGSKRIFFKVEGVSEPVERAEITRALRQCAVQRNIQEEILVDFVGP
jgi:hypothetical protein